jgi:hypothetical protein
MLERIFPKQLDNTYRGRSAALVIFVVYLAIKFLQGTMSVFNTHDTAINADGIPLDTFSAAAAQTAITMFALLGLYLMLLSLLGVVALLRYRALVPLLFLFFIVQNLAVRLVLLAQPIVRTGMPIGVIVNLGLLGLLVIGFVLSLTGRRYGASPAVSARMS